MSAVTIDTDKTAAGASSQAALTSSLSRGERETLRPASIIELELANPTFCGPLALLLELIENRKLPITEVSLAQVADQYLDRMRSLIGLDMEILADFLVIAARLLVIKSRALLPPRISPHEGPDEASDLPQRLLEYRMFRDAAEQLRRLEESGRRGYPRQAPFEPSRQAEPPLEPVPPAVLRAAMIRMLKALRPEPERQTLAPRVSVQERIEYLKAYLRTRGGAVFSELAGATVQEVVATFLALLELLRRELIVAQQESPFAEIRLTLAKDAATAG